MKLSLSSPEGKAMFMQALLDTGLLFDLNRRVLHPEGLALGVQVNDQKEVMDVFIWDAREDPEGITFTGEAFVTGAEKLHTYQQTTECKARQDARIERFGYVEQTYPVMVEP